MTISLLLIILLSLQVAGVYVLLIGMEANHILQGRKIPFRLLTKGYKNLMKLATELSSGGSEFTAFGLSEYLLPSSFRVKTGGQG